MTVKMVEFRLNMSTCLPTIVGVVYCHKLGRIVIDGSEVKVPWPPRMCNLEHG